MNNHLTTSDQYNGLVAHDRVLKATSLLYFKEALLNQQYEDCAELIRAAKSFGARPGEISRVIAEAIRGEQGGPPNEAKGVPRTRLKGFL